MTVHILTFMRNSRLDGFFMSEYVANLAFTTYEGLIRDGTIFDDVDLFQLYFSNSGKVDAVKALVGTTNIV